MVKDVPFTGSRAIDVVGAVLSVLGMGGLVLGILIWQEGGEAVGLFLAVGVVALGSFAWWLIRRKRSGGVPLIDPDLFRSQMFRLGISGQTMQQLALGGLMISLPIFLQMVLEYNALQAGLSIAPLSLSMFVIAMIAGRRKAKRRVSGIIRIGFVLMSVGVAILIALVPRADSGLWLTVPLIIAGCGLGLLVSQLNNYTLAPISEERISEAAGVNSAGGSFGLSLGLALAGAVMLATLSITFTNQVEASTVIPPDQQAQVAAVLDEDAQIMSNTALTELLAGQPPEIQAEIIRINTDVRPFALQVALLVPLLAGLLGLATSFRMASVPEVEPSAAIEGLAFG
jgi:hypothetical protein